MSDDADRPNVTRDELACEVSLLTGQSVAKARKAVDGVLAALAEAVTEGRTVELRGFGIFKPVERKPKVGRNPSNPAAGRYAIPARRGVRFRLSRTLHLRLNPNES